MLGPRPDLTALARTSWDVIVIGGGITGAGVLLEAAQRGKKALLLEQEDFAWGTSSRSSKMVHGGLRYVAQGHLRLTRDALRERERLLRELPDLVIRQPYAFVVRQGEFPGRWVMEAVLSLYDMLAGIWDHHWIARDRLLERIPSLAPQGLRGAMIYTDALTDDARLVLRVLHEAAMEGAHLSNYVRVQAVQPQGQGFSVSARDQITGAAATLTAPRVINASGAWAGELSGESKKIRPLRGSHLLFSRDRLPVNDCVTVLHPKDRRPVFIFPWLGLTCVGTTDLDHRGQLSDEPRCTAEEMDYLFEVIHSQFRGVALTPADVVSTFSGVRPVIASGKGLNPSQESREHKVWYHEGMVCVAGGKLTTFRLVALDALLAAGLINKEERRLARETVEPLFRHRVTFPGRLGHPASPLPEGEALLEAIGWVIDNEMVVHLDDLLLRRVRLGNTERAGARVVLPQLRGLCQSRFGWDDARWAEEARRYEEIAGRNYGRPQGGSAP